MISVNERAAWITRQMVADSEALGLQVASLANGSTLIDAGVRTPGSLNAGRMFAEASLGGLGKVDLGHKSYSSHSVASFWLPAVQVSVIQPPIACLASQYAGWSLQGDGFFAMGSGPARALYAQEELYARLEYRDRADAAVLLLEGRQLPGVEIADQVAKACGVSPQRLTLVIAPTASLVGSLQIAARAVETGLHKLMKLGFDVRRVLGGYGVCPLAPLAADDLHAIGRTNDAVLYGSQVFYTIDAEDETLAGLVGQLPSSASRDYGTPFYELFQRYGGDFYQIDPLLFSPAQVTINNCASGRSFTAGQVNPELLHASLLAG